MEFQLSYVHSLVVKFHSYFLDRRVPVNFKFATVMFTCAFIRKFLIFSMNYQLWAAVK